MKQGNELQQATPISTNLVKIKHMKNSGNKSETYAGSWHGWSAILLLVWNGHEILNRSKPLPQGPAEIEGEGMVAGEQLCLTTYLTGCVCRFVKETLRLCYAYSILIEFWSHISIFLESSRKSLREGGGYLQSARFEVVPNYLTATGGSYYDMFALLILTHTGRLSHKI